MRLYRWVRPLALGVAYTTLAATTASAQERIRVTSPDGRNEVTVEVRNGNLLYSMRRDGRVILLPSGMGFEFQGAPPLRDGLRVVAREQRSTDQTWMQPWGEVARVRDHHNELRVSVSEGAAPTGSSWWRSASSTTG